MSHILYRSAHRPNKHAQAFVLRILALTCLNHTTTFPTRDLYIKRLSFNVYPAAGLAHLQL